MTNSPAQRRRLVDDIRALTHTFAKKLSAGVDSNADEEVESELLKLDMTMESLTMYETRQKAQDSIWAGNTQECWQPHDTELMYRQLVTVDKLLEMCNMTFERMSSARDPLHPDKRSLTQLASDIMSEYCEAQNNEQLQEEMNILEEKSEAIKKQHRELFKSNKRYCKSATSLKIELDEYAKRLDLRATLLEKSYLKYCEIMKEWGIKPSSLCAAHDELFEARITHEAAWEHREATATTAGQVARENVVE